MNFTKIEIQTVESRETPINLRVQPSALLMLLLGDGSKVDTSRA